MSIVKFIRFHQIDASDFSSSQIEMERIESGIPSIGHNRHIRVALPEETANWRRIYESLLARRIENQRFKK